MQGKFFDILRARREGKSPPALASPEYPVGGKPFPPGVGCKELQCSTDDNIDSEERLRGIVSSYEPAELGVNLTMLSGVEKQVLQSVSCSISSFLPLLCLNGPMPNTAVEGCRYCRRSFLAPAVASKRATGACGISYSKRTQAEGGQCER